MTDSSPGARSGLPHLQIAALGLVTIAAYGSGFYAFGVLLGPIIDDEGWSEGLVAAAFSASSIVGALGAGLAGRLVDEVGARRVIIVGGLVGCLFLVVAARSPAQLMFAPAYALGGGLLTAAGFYHVTQAAAARVAPENPARAIMLLTLYGAFAGPIYLPIAGLLVDAAGWRTALTLLSAASATGFIIAGFMLRTPTRASGDRREAISFLDGLRDPAVRVLMIAGAVGGIGVSTLMVYQVPLMVSAGLSLGTAASVSGLRGFAQFGGRAAVIPILPRVSARQILLATYLMLSLSAVLLAGSGTIAVALIYVTIAGVGIGVFSPMEAIYANEIFPPERVATFLGTQRMVAGLGGALGPVTAGVLADATGSRLPAVVIAATATLAAAVILGAGTSGLSGRQATAGGDA